MKKVTILKMLVVLAIAIMISGCAVEEAYLLNQPIHPPVLSSNQKQKMQVREIRRQKREAEECLRLREKGEHSNTGVHVLTLIFF